MAQRPLDALAAGLSEVRQCPALTNPLWRRLKISNFTPHCGWWSPCLILAPKFRASPPPAAPSLPHHHRLASLFRPQLSGSAFLPTCSNFSFTFSSASFFNPTLPSCLSSLLSRWFRSRSKQLPCLTSLSGGETLETITTKFTINHPTRTIHCRTWCCRVAQDAGLTTHRLRQRAAAQTAKCFAFYRYELHSSLPRA